jgi:integrase/recombinase XerD
VKPLRGNPKNDRAKREYLIYLKDARQRSPATVEQVRHAIDRLETYTGFKDFGSFNKEQALGFKRALLAAKAQRSGRPISTATAHHVLQALKEFLAWLHGRPGYRRRIDLAHIAYLNLTAKDERIAHVTAPKSYASLEQYRAALFAMPNAADVERRDQALMALLLLTGMRDAAVVSLRLKHISIERDYVFQDPREVNTKFSKPIETFFYPVGDDVADIINGWVQHLTSEKLFGPTDPLFPKTLVRPDERGSFVVQGLSREHWADAAPVRAIFKDAFTRVALPYFRPHTVRDTLTQLAYRLQLSPEQLKAWSQNMGHSNVLTTLSSYGHISTERQGEILAQLPRFGEAPVRPDMATEIAATAAQARAARPDHPSLGRPADDAGGLPQSRRQPPGGVALAATLCRGGRREAPARGVPQARQGAGPCGDGRQGAGLDLRRSAGRDHSLDRPGHGQGDP